MFRPRVSAASLAVLTLIGASPALSQEQNDSLLATAEEEGVVRVIAVMNVGYQSPETMSLEAAQQQFSAIASAQNQLAVDYGENVVETFDRLPMAVLEVDSENLQILRQSDLVSEVVLDELSEPTLAQSVPLINADDAWSEGYSGAGQTVAVLDTGVDASHPFLAGKVVSQACFSTTSSANGGSVSLCPNGSGSQIGGNSGRNCTGIGGCDHGTHVAGIAAGKGSSFSGVARDANLIAIQVFSRFNSPATCSPRPAPCVLSYTSDQIKALQQIVSLSATFSVASINMSLGGGKNNAACDSNPAKPIIDTLKSKRIATVIASGNNGFSDGIGAPACISSAVSVGSTTKSDTVSSFSNSSTILDLLAPGSAINSSVLGGGFAPKDGTSMATPHAAGAFAVDRQRFPSDTVDQTLARLKNNGVAVTGKGVTKPRIDLAYIKGGGDATMGPLAFGVVYFNGSKQSGTPNWSSTFNATFNRYEISITGENYYYLKYATAVTAAGDKRFCKSSSVSGKLLVYCYDAAGVPATSRFGFVTFKN